MGLAAAGLMLLAGAAASQTLYKHVGPDGKVTYSDKPPASAPGSVREMPRVQQGPAVPLGGSQPLSPPSAGIGGVSAQTQEEYRNCMRANAKSLELVRASEELVRTVTNLKNDTGRTMNRGYVESQLKRQWDYYKSLGGTAAAPEQVRVPDDPCKAVKESAHSQIEAAQGRYRECAASRADEVRLAQLSRALVENQKWFAMAEAMQAEKRRDPQKFADTKGSGEWARLASVEPAQMRAVQEETFREYRRSGGTAARIEEVTPVPNPCAQELEKAFARPPGSSSVGDTRVRIIPGQAPAR